MSPPPEYEPPRPIPFRTDSAPNFAHSASGATPSVGNCSHSAAPPATATAPRRPNDRRARPMTSIASTSWTKDLQLLGINLRPPTCGLPDHQNLAIMAPVVQPTFRQDYNNPPQASTSYLPPQPQFAQQYGQNNMHASPVPKEREPRWSQPYPGQPPSPAQPVHPHPSHDPRASYIPQTQYDPMDPPPQPQNGNPYYPDPNPPPPGHHAMYTSEDSNSDAYGGIEVDLTPKQERYSAPPAPPASQMQVEPLYAPQNGGPNGGFDPRRHSVQAGYAPPPDPRLFNELDRLNAGQNLSNIHPSHNGQPMAGFIDPRISQNHDQFERSAYQQQQIAALAQDRPQSVIAPSIAGTANTQRHRLPQHTPKHLVMPTPLQQNSQLPNHASSQNYHAEHYSPNSSQVRLPLQQAQPTRAQTIQMVQDKDGGRHLLRKRTSAVQPSVPAPPMPPKAPPVTRQRSYMEPPPTMPEAPIHRQMQQEKKRPKRLLSKRRTDL
ncbi:hypothetical protein B0H13DRAFT_2307729 [Mycena leptocephala]|nr:hypothetical protein B0H13DRAFT_2307729 [Mycena leptocephala]